MADIDFCITESRGEAEHRLHAALPGIKPRWLFFENGPVACKANIRDRPDRPAEMREWELKYVDDNAARYKIPQDTKVLPLYRKPAD